MPLSSGDVFAGYSIYRLLGAGAMGEVYLAQHPRLPRLDALKILPTSVTRDRDFRERFNREADLAAALWHPHIVGLHDRGEIDGQLWISMDYVEGTDAANLLLEQHPNGMPVNDVLEIVTAVADALDYAHACKLLHRDVKPANILLTDSGPARRRILLADFGIARRTDDISGLTATNMTVGSLAYAAPEQLLGEPLDGGADQYALAASAFQLLTGAPLFQHSNPAVVIGKHLNTPPPPVGTHRPDLARLDPVLATALDKDPRRRYPLCLDFAHALGDCITAVPTRDPATLPKVARGVDPKKARYQTHLQAAVTQPAQSKSTAAKAISLRPRPPRTRVVGIALASLLVGVAVLASAAASMYAQQREAEAALAREQRFVDTASLLVVDMFSYTQETVDASVDRFISSTSGPLRAQMTEGNNVENLKAIFRDTGGSSETVINGAALESIDETANNASVLVAARVTESDKHGNRQPSKPYRLRVIVHEDDNGQMSGYDLNYPDEGN